LDYLKTQAKSGDMAVLQLLVRNMSLGNGRKIDPLPAGEADSKNLKKIRPGPNGRVASRWYGRLRMQKLTLSVLKCAHAPGQSFRE